MFLPDVLITAILLAVVAGFQSADFLQELILSKQVVFVIFIFIPSAVSFYFNHKLHHCTNTHQMTCESLADCRARCSGSEVENRLCD